MSKVVYLEAVYLEIEVGFILKEKKKGRRLFSPKTVRINFSLLITGDPVCFDLPTVPEHYPDKLVNDGLNVQPTPRQSLHDQKQAKTEGSYKTQRIQVKMMKPIEDNIFSSLQHFPQRNEKKNKNENEQKT